MFIIVDEREMVTSGYASRFGSEGISSTGFCPEEFREWVETVAAPDLARSKPSCSAIAAIARVIRG